MATVPIEQPPGPRPRRVKPVMWLLLLAVAVALVLVAWLRPGRTIEGRDDAARAPHSTPEQQPAYAHPRQQGR